MNLGIKARGVLSHSGNTVETIVPLNHCSFNAGGIRNCAAGRQQNDLGTLDPSPKIISLKHFTSMAATLQNYSPAAFSIAANITLKLIMPAILKQESLAT